MTIVDGTYSAFLVPISIAFLTDLNHWTWTTIIDVIAGKQLTFKVEACCLLHQTQLH